MLLLALATNYQERPALLDHGIDALAATMTPLALAAVGFALQPRRLAGRLGPLAGALADRLIAAPLTLLALLAALEMADVITLDPMVRNVAILEMAMPPMLGATIIAMESDLEPDLVALIIGFGIPLSLLTATIWWHVLGMLGWRLGPPSRTGTAGFWPPVISSDLRRWGSLSNAARWR